MLLASNSVIDELIDNRDRFMKENTLRQSLVAVVALLVLIPIALAAADERLTFLAVDMVTSRDSIRILGNITFAESDTSSSLELLLSPEAAVHAMYFRSEDDSITAHFDRIGFDTIVVKRSSTHAFARARVLSFEMTFPIDRNNDSLIILDRGNRWYPVLPHGLTYVIMQVFVTKDDEVLSTGNKVRHEAAGAVWYEFATSFPVYKIPLVKARPGFYRSCTKLAGSHEIAMHYFSVSDSAASRILDEAVNAFTFYESLIGPYQHHGLSLVEAPGFEGINIGTGLLSVGSLTMKALAGEHYESLTLTIAAQWFGAGVFSDFPSPGFWFMSLSLPHYLRLRYESRDLDSFKCDALFDRQFSAYREIAGKENDTPLMDIMRPDSREKGIILYSKGPWLVYRLQKCLGGDSFLQTLRAIHVNSLGKVLSIEGFMAEIAKQDENCARELKDALWGRGL